MSSVLGKQAGGACKPRTKHLRFRSLSIVDEGEHADKSAISADHRLRTMSLYEGGCCMEATLGPWGIQIVNEVSPASLVA